MEFKQRRHIQTIPITPAKKMLTEQQIKSHTNQPQNQKIYKLQLCSISLTRIQNLKSFPNIRYLNLGFNRISQIENLQSLTDLRELHLEGNCIREIKGLDACRMLNVVNLGRNAVERVENLGALARLDTLMLDCNRIQKIYGLEGLKDLKYLSVSGNKLKSIDSLPSFSKLQSLIASHNNLTTIPTSLFTKCNKLTKLNLSHNELTDTTFINVIQSLEDLDLSDNKINQIGFGPLKNLEILNVSRNRISTLPKISGLFPELAVFLFGGNQVFSQFQLIQSFAEAEMLVEVDYTDNLIDNPNFPQTLYKVYGFDRINKKNYNKAGTRYITQAQQIRQTLQEEGSFQEMENDEEMRKIIMSGFYNDQLEADMTGVKPDRPNSANRNRGSKINYEDIEKSYNQILKNQKRLQNLRNQCLYIFQSNGIQVKIPGFKPHQGCPSPQPQSPLVTQPKNLIEKTTSINTPNSNSIEQLTSKNEENMNKWKQLKNREKSFNIRGAVRKTSGSQKKSGVAVKEGSLSKIVSAQERTQLMKTQLQPPRWNNDPSLMKTMQARPLSSKKKC